jgi:hypothetical protein
VKRPIQASRIRVPGKTMVHNPVTGNAILCAWDDCPNPGYDEIKILVRESRTTKTLHYIFCSEKHKRYHLIGHHAYGRLSR